MEIEQKGEGYTLTLKSEGESLPLWQMLVNFEREIIGSVLTMFNGNKAKTADYLQLNRTTLVEKAKKYGFPSKKRSSPGYTEQT